MAMSDSAPFPLRAHSATLPVSRAGAVIFEEWNNGPETLTFVMATTPPNALIARITDPDACNPAA
jgi:hypothetical protein